MTEDWTNRNITVLGLARSGIATARYLKAKGANIWISDAAEPNEERNAQVEELEKNGIKVELGRHSQEALEFGDLIVISPGFKPTSDVVKAAQALGKEIVCDIEIAYRESKAPIIAITGTNGKSTTTALVSFLLEKCGKRAPACGNFGVPILSVLDQDPAKHPDYLIVEVSSYQLFYTTQFAPLISVWMNLTPDHLDWHGGIEGYIEAKLKAFANQKSSQYAVLNYDDPIVAKTKCNAQIYPFGLNAEIEKADNGAFIDDGYLAYKIGGKVQRLCKPNELQIIGKHNLENALAAISVCALIGLKSEDVERYLKEFKALEHRLEYVDTVNGVAYYNDSKATNTDSAIKALEAFPDQKVVLIAGGRDKGTPLSDFVHSVRKHASAVILIGEAKQRFEHALREVGVGDIYPVDSLEEAVALGEKLKLGPVLLSPACASFDMFKDFEDRGRVFKDIVGSRR